MDAGHQHRPAENDDANNRINIHPHDTNKMKFNG